MNARQWITVAVALVVGFAAGVWIGGDDGTGEGIRRFFSVPPSPLSNSLSIYLFFQPFTQLWNCIPMGVWTCTEDCTITSLMVTKS